MTQMDPKMGLERVVLAVSGRDGRNHAVRPEQKSFSWVKDILASSSKMWQLLVTPVH